jgi:hypothetical protein
VTDRDNDLYELLERAVSLRGRSPVEAALKKLGTDEPETTVRTIIANAGVHSIPKAYLRGEVYEASRGDWDVSTEEALLTELRGILSGVVSKLRSQSWSRIYLIPTGHPVLSLQIKAMVYRILRFNTVDLYYKNGFYFEVDLDQRSIALGRGEGQ